MSKSKNNAINKINNYISDNFNRKDIILLEDEIIPFEFGWIFFYQSKRYLETGNTDFMLGGNCPLIYDHEFDRIVETGTRLQMKYYVSLYSKYRMDLEEFNDVIGYFVPEE